MLRGLEYPFSVEEISRTRLKLKRLLSQKPGLTPLRVALCGGITTSEIRAFMELLLLKEGFHPTFFESEYNKYFEDILVDDSELRTFSPELIWICTSGKNILKVPSLNLEEAGVAKMAEVEVEKFESLWKKLSGWSNALVLQNNFDRTLEQPLGMLDTREAFGTSAYFDRLNQKLTERSKTYPSLVVLDIDGLSHRLGLETWVDGGAWFSYKWGFSQKAQLQVAYAATRLFLAAKGRSKKVLIVDLDNTLWGGVIGDEGVENLKLGRETALGEAHLQFQQYLKSLKERGILLAVCSKNEDVIARSGFSHLDSVLKIDDFSAFKANWNPKDQNIREIANELGLGLESFVFIDDNPAERERIRQELPMVAVPEVGSNITNFIRILDGSFYFEALKLSADDLQRARFYAANAERAKEINSFASYEEYLASLEMVAEIAPFSATYLDRITQLTNKTNQFNLTTRRYTRAEMQKVMSDPNAITLYGRLSDKFGDNGLISALVASIQGGVANIDLWLMSCRVLKRDMEFAMLDALVESCQAKGVREIHGLYLKTPKNGLVAKHYEVLGFEQSGDTTEERSEWRFVIPQNYEFKNRTIRRTHVRHEYRNQSRDSATVASYL